MKLRTLWIWRVGAEGAEMVQAWDEWSVDENGMGWQEACETTLKEAGDDVLEHRYIDVEIDYRKVEDIFRPGSLPGEVKEHDTAKA